MWVAIQAAIWSSPSPKCLGLQDTRRSARFAGWLKRSCVRPEKSRHEWRLSMVVEPTSSWAQGAFSFTYPRNVFVFGICRGGQNVNLRR